MTGHADVFFLSINSKLFHCYFLNVLFLSLLSFISDMNDKIFIEISETCVLLFKKNSAKFHVTILWINKTRIQPLLSCKSKHCQ